MNISLGSHFALKKALAAKLGELLGQVEWLGEFRVDGSDLDPWDLIARLPSPTGATTALYVECKRELRPSSFAQIAGRELPPVGKETRAVRVLGLPMVTSRIAELCAENGWSWFDLAGNCRLDIPEFLYIQHSGNAPVHRSPRPRANIGTPEAARVIRALLLPGNVSKRWTQREMQNHCEPNVSLGLVNKVVRHLREEAFIEESNHGFLLRDPLKLLFAWRDVYCFDRHERRSYFSLLQGKRLREALADLESIPNGEAAYASFSAATMQWSYVRQPKTWLYLSADLEEAFCEKVDAKPVDSGENIVVLIPNDDGVFYQREIAPSSERHLASTNPVQTYVDLWHSGGRGREAAEALLEHRLKPEWNLRSDA